MPSGFGLLQCIGKAAVKHIVNLVSFGVGGDLLVDVWDNWRRATKEEQRAAEVQAIAQLSPAELRAEVARIVREEAAALSPVQQVQVASYLTQVPASIHRSLRRPSDPTGTTLAPGVVFRAPEDLLPLLPAALPRFKVGDRPLPGVDWELVELLGVGGFGEVWKARNPHFDGVALVALKFCQNARARDRLLKHEAGVLNQVMRQGQHKGIVPLLHTYLSAEPPCLAYEYIDGGDLAGLIQERRGGLSARVAAQVIQQLAEIVGFAHRLSPPIVHRDLKPANILVKSRPGGKFALRITDFGIGGLAIQQAVEQSRSGSSGAFLASALRGAYTPLYASPQQMRGDAPDPRDDVYALGVIWYQMITGDLTKGRPGGEAWRKRLADLGMTPALLALLASSYEDERADRPVSAVVLAEELGRLLNEPAPAQTPPTIPKEPGRPAPPPVEQPRSSLEGMIVNSIGMKLVLVNSGVFVMGSPGNETYECQHEVEITQPFYAGIYPVTQEQYERVMGNNPSWFSPTGSGKSEVKGMDTRQFPVENVSWEEAVEFCRRLAALLEEKANSRTYRLPTEAEWEYVCRGGPFFKAPATVFSFGNSLSSTQANFDGKYGHPTQVGTYSPNALGVHDLHGNVWEWCSDWFDSQYYKRSPRKDPQGPKSGQRRVFRGGSWNVSGPMCRAACRVNYPPGARYYNGGFRVVFGAGART